MAYSHLRITFPAVLLAFSLAASAGDHLGCISEMRVPEYLDLELRYQMDYYLREQTRYSDRCEGQVVKLVFIHRFEGDPTDDPKTVVHFQPPNRLS